MGAPLRTRLANRQRRIRRQRNTPMLLKHSSIAEIATFFPIEGCRAIAVVRDPVERAASMLRYARQTKGRPADPALVAAFDTVRKSPDDSAFILSGAFEEMLHLRFFRPQWDCVTIAGKLACEALIPIGELDRFGEFVDIPPSLRTSRVNASEKEAGLSDEARQVLRRLYAADYANIPGLAAHAEG